MNSSANPVVHLKIERRSNHPWIFQKMVEKPDPRPKPGSIVDIVGRMGGDEFAVILVQADARLATGKALGLQLAIEREPMRFGEWSAPLHISYGVCEISQALEPEEIVAAADRAMYAAKRAGRNRVAGPCELRAAEAQPALAG